MLGYEDTLAGLYEVLKPYAGDGQVLHEETELVADLGLDSMKSMQLLLEAEDRFDISIPLNILPEVHTVRDLAGQIHHLTIPR